jgi:hypothetical protein
MHEDDDTATGGFPSTRGVMDVSNFDDNNLPGWLGDDPTPTTPGVETDIIDDYNVNPITGAERPEDFQIHNHNPLFCGLESLTSEIPWLTSEGYKWVGEDLDWARYLLVSVALAMREPLGRLLDDVISAYRVFEKEDFACPRSLIPEHDALLGEVGGHVWQAAGRGVSEDEIVEHVRKSIARFKVMDAGHRARQGIGADAPKAKAG